MGKLVYTGIGINENRLEWLSTRVTTPDRTKNYEDCLRAFEQWERDLEEFQKLTNTKMHQISQLTALKRLVPKELEEDISRSSTIRTYESARDYMHEQIHNRRDTYGAKKSKDVNGYDETEENCKKKMKMSSTSMEKVKGTEKDQDKDLTDTVIFVVSKAIN